MKILVTGASGNLGSAVLREVTAGGDHQITALARRAPKVPESKDASVRWRATDVARDRLEPIVEGHDAVVHLAWKFQPTHGPAETWETNVVGTRRVLDAARRAGIETVVCASSVAAYSPAAHDDDVGEDWATEGASSAAYCREKAYNERALDAFELAHPEIRVVRLRPAFVFQRSAASEQRRIFGGALARPTLLDRRLLPVLPLPRGLRLQAVHAEDVGRAVRASLERPVRGAFNLAGEGVLRREELGAIVGARTVEVAPAPLRHLMNAGWHLRALPVPGSLLTALMQVPVMSTARATADLGWQPRHSGADAIEAFLSGVAMRGGSGLPPLHR